MARPSSSRFTNPAPTLVTLFTSSDPSQFFNSSTLGNSSALVHHGTESTGYTTTSLVAGGIQINLTPVVLPNNRLSWTFYVENPEAITNFQFYTADTGSFGKFSINQFSASEIRRGWNTVSFAIDKGAITGGDPDFALTDGVGAVRIYCTSTSLASRARVWVDSCYGGIRGKAILCLSYDDNADGQFTTGLGDLDGLGLKGTFGIISVASDDVATVQAAQANGHLFIAHGDTIVTTIGDQQAVEDEIQSVWAAEFAKGIELDRRYYIYPNGLYNSPGVKAAMDNLGIRLARIVGGQKNHVVGYPLNAEDIHWRQWFRQIGWDQNNGSTVTTAKAQLDALVEDGAFGCLMFHAIVSSGDSGLEINDADHLELLTYAKSLQDAGLLEILTFDQLWDSLKGERPLAART